MDPDPSADPSIDKQKNLENPLFLQFCELIVPTVSNKPNNLGKKNIFGWDLDSQ